jgi:poly [ADP-ribose] polymerase
MKVYKSKISGGYTELEINYEKEAKKEKTTKQETKQTKPKKTAESKLEEPVTNLIKMIYDMDTMETQMKEIGFNTDKQPLGRLGAGTLKKGYEILKEIEQVLNKKKKGDLSQLSSDFYTHIPHCFGFSHMSNYIITNMNTIKKKMNMLESLGEIEIATKLMDESEETEDTSIYDIYYKKLNCDIAHLKPEVKFFLLLGQDL